MKTVQTTQQTQKKKQCNTVFARLYASVIERLDKFFGTAPYTLEWARSESGRAGVLITYTDFLSEGLVYQLLEDIIPKEVKVSIVREYSDNAVARILLQEYRKNRVAVVDCYGGELRPETIRNFVRQKLDAVEMLS